ncbi:MAG: competence protein ComEC [Verrucomicrobiales bacterium]|jgi:competence protein ComEC
MWRDRFNAMWNRWAVHASNVAFPPLALLAVAALLGAFGAHFLDQRVGVWLWGTAVACSVSVFLRHRRMPALAVAVGLSFALMHSMKVQRVRNIPHRDAMMAGQDFFLTMTGIVMDEPRQFGERGFRFPMRLESIQEDSEFTTSSVTVLTSVTGINFEPAYGDRLEVKGWLSFPELPMNPGQFDSRQWFLQQGYAGDFYSVENVSMLGGGNGNSFFAAALQSRSWIKERLIMGLDDDPDTASVIAAMVLGMRSETPDEIEDAFVGSGTMHVFAVSGLHVGLFGYLAWMFLKAMGIRRPNAIAIIIPGLIFYAFVTGLRPSACRATIMAVIVLVGYLCDRVPSMPNSLGAAALVILSANTLQVLQPGFQLSFVVLAAIVVIAPRVRAPLQKLSEPDPFLPKTLLSVSQRVVTGVGTRVADVFSVSLAAWLGSVFLVLHHFEIATPIAVIANCFLVPCAFLILFTSSVSLVLGTLFGSWLGLICNQTNWLLAKGTVLLATFFAGMPGGGAELTEGTSGVAGTLHATILHLDEGGGCSYVSVGGGEAWFFDAGHATDLSEVLRPFLDFRGIENIDAMLLSHADSGHIGGASWLSDALQPRQIIVSSQPYRSPIFSELRDKHAVADSLLSQASAGREFALGGGSVARILFPPQGAEIAIADDQAMVVQLEHEGWRILFMSDAGFSTEQWLLTHCRYLDSDVLVKGMHETDFSGGAEFLDAVSPQVVISSNARFPRGQLIADEWRGNISERGMVLFDQMFAGAVEITAEAGKLTVEGFVSGGTVNLHK